MCLHVAKLTAARGAASVRDADVDSPFFTSGLEIRPDVLMQVGIGVGSFRVPAEISVVELLGLSHQKRFAMRSSALLESRVTPS